MQASDIALSGRITRPVALPVRKITAYVRALYAGEQIRFEETLKAVKDDPATFVALHLSAYLCQEDGSPLVDVEQARALIDTAAPADIRALVEAGVNLNSVKDDAVESAAKN